MQQQKLSLELDLCKVFVLCYPLFEMEKYLFIVSVAVEHSSVLVIDHLVHKLVWV